MAATWVARAHTLSVDTAYDYHMFILNDKTNGQHSINFIIIICIESTLFFAFESVEGL